MQKMIRDASGDARVYDGFAGHEWYQKANQHLVDLMGIKPGQRGFDGGCGTGTVIPLILDKVGGSGFLVGVDKSETMLAVARQKFGEVPNILLLEGDLRKLDFVVSPHKPLHFGVIANTIHYLPDEDKMRAFQNAFDVLEHGGVLGVNTGFAKEAKLPETGHIYQGFAGTIVSKVCELYSIDSGVVHDTILSLKRRDPPADRYKELMEDAGFEVEHTSLETQPVSIASLRDFFHSTHSTNTPPPHPTRDCSTDSRRIHKRSFKRS